MNPASSGLTVPPYPTVVGSTHTAQGLGPDSVQTVMSAQTDEIFNGPFIGGEVCIADQAVRCSDSPECGQSAFVPRCVKRTCSASYPVSRHLQTRRTVRPRSYYELASGVVRCNDGGCKRVFPDRAAWSRHQHEQAEKLFTCPKANCGKSYTRRSNLVNHLRAHSGERPFKCRYPGCRSAFTRSSYLSSHVKTHQPERPFQCAFCLGVFSSKRGLIKHVNTIHSA